MTQKVNPSFDRDADSFQTAGAIALAGGSADGWVSPSAEPSSISAQDAGIDETVLDAFSETSSGTSFDVTIAPGEAFVYGSWLAKDTTTTVTLSSGTAAQTVYVGWQEGAADTVLIGLDSAFTASDKRIPLFDFDTDGSGVTSVTDRRELGQFQDLSHAAIADELGIPVYADTTNAPQKEGYVVFIDGSGSQESGLFVHDGSSYREGGNTDEEVQDLVAALLSGGTNITATYDDTADTLTIDTSALNQEEVEDTVNALVADGNAIATTYDDANDTLTIDVTESDINTDNITEGTSNLFYTDERVDDEVNALIIDGNAISTSYDDANDELTIQVVENDISISNLAGDSDNVTEGTTNLYFTDERAQDAVGTITSGGDKIAATYDDSANTLTIDTTALDGQEVDDRVNSLLSSGDKLSTTYDDANDTLTIDTTALDAEEVEDQVDSLLVGGTNISYTYDDTNDTLTINTSALNNEGVEDAVNTLITDGNAINTTYDDANDTLTIDVSESNISLGNLSGDTDSITEGTTNLYFTDERSQDAVGTIVGTLLNYDDAAPAITISIDDDELLHFGTGDDVSQRYDATNDDLRWQDENNSADRMALDRTTGNLNITGEITENASL